jgi:hypothetical protein
MARGAPKRGPGLRVLLSNPEETTMATRRKKKTTKKRAKRANPTRRRRRRNAPKRHAAAGYTVGKSRVRRRKLNPGKRHHRRRRHNPSFGGAGMKQLVMTGLKAVAGGMIGVLAGRMLEAHVSQPPRTMGAIEVAAGLAGLYIGSKMGQPAIGLGFAGGLGGVQGGAKLLDSFTTPTPPAVPPGMPPPPAMPAGATPPDAMAAVETVDEGDLEGAEGLAAVEVADEDEEGAPYFGGDDGAFPFSGSTPEYG